MSTATQRGFTSWFLWVAVWLLSACSKQEPVKIGFIGTLSRGAADVGQAGRNGVILAVEQRNAALKSFQRPVELLIEDDAQDPAQATQAFEKLQRAGVVAIVGPFSSSVAAALVPLANDKRMVLVSPTVTSMDFVGKDDHLFRIHRSTRDNATDYAHRLLRDGLKSVSVAYDQRNRSFTTSWLNEFRSTYTTQGGQVVSAYPFGESGSGNHEQVARELLAKPASAVLMIANAVDSARVLQHVRHISPKPALVVAEWAASESLIELGGRAIEGLLVLHPFDRFSSNPDYGRFREAFQHRFGTEPGYSAVAAHDAATVVFSALDGVGRHPDLKTSLLQEGPYQGLQQPILFDAFGDTSRLVAFNRVEGGRFVSAP